MLSIIIPVLEEEAAIGESLARLQALRAAGAEVIVVDGGSRDATRAIAEPLADRVGVAPRGRSSQMNAGAAVSRGEALLFLHADTTLPDGAPQAIASALLRRAWGRFDVEISGASPLLRVVAFCMNARLAPHRRRHWRPGALHDARGLRRGRRLSRDPADGRRRHHQGAEAPLAAGMPAPARPHLGPAVGEARHAAHDPENFAYRKFQARAYRVSAGAGRTVKTIEDEIGSRTVIERIVRKGTDVEPDLDIVLEAGDDGRHYGADRRHCRCQPVIGTEIDADEILRAIPGNVVEVLVDSRKLHGRSIKEVAERIGDNARGVFLRALSRMGREVPLSPDTRIYVGDIMTLVGSTGNIERAAAEVGQILRPGDRTDVAFLAAGIAAGLLAGLLSVKVGSIASTLGGGGGALIAGLVCGWLRSRRPTMGALPPAAQQTLSDLGLGGFIAAIGLGNGHAAWTAIQAHGLLLVGMASSSRWCR